MNNHNKTSLLLLFVYTLRIYIFRLGTDRVLSQNHEVVFDENGIPIPELDGSIPDIFENHNDDGMYF